MATNMQCTVCHQFVQDNEAWAFYLDGDVETVLHDACAQRALLSDSGPSGANFRKWSVEPMGVEKPPLTQERAASVSEKK